MFVTVYVDIDTFRTLVLERKTFDACMNMEQGVSIAILVPVNQVYTHQEEDMVIVENI